MDSKSDTSRKIDSQQWVDRYGDTMFRYTLVRVRDRDVAEEIVQTTLLAALQAQHSFEGRSSEKSWLFGILKHKIMDHFRDLKNKRIFEQTSEDEDTPLEDLYNPEGHWINPPKPWDIDPEKSTENEQLLKALTHCLDHLSEKHRNIFILKEIEGLSSEEICKEFNIQPTNLWVILHRARNQLRKCLEAAEWNQKP